MTNAAPEQFSLPRAWLAQPGWLGDMLSFVCGPAAWMHASWRTALFPGDIREELFDCAAALPYLSRQIVSMLDTGEAEREAWPQGPEWVLWQVVLRSPAELLSLALAVGVMLTGASVRQVVGRERVVDFVSVLGEAVFSMAERSILLVEDGVTLEHADIVSGSAYKSAALRIGCGAMRHVFEERHTAVWLRLRLKLPHEMAMASPVGRSPARMEALLLRACKNIGEETWNS